MSEAIGRPLSPNPSPPQAGEREEAVPQGEGESRKRRITRVARKLRNNPTEAEKKLWAMIRADQLGVRFRRQYTIKPYIADFACPAVKLIIEVDGGQHAENPRDLQRTRFLERKGYRVIRFWNNDVLGNAPGVLETIREAVRA